MKTIYVAFFLLTIFMSAAGNADGQSTKNKIENRKIKKTNMNTIQDNKEVVRKVFEEAINKRNFALLEDLISQDYPGVNGQKGPEAFSAPIKALIIGFPDMQWKVQSLIGEENTVAVRWRLQGKSTADLQLYVATNKEITNDGMAIFTLENGKVVSAFLMTDRLAFLQQMEVIPQNINYLSNKKEAKLAQVNFIDRFVIPENAKKEFLERANFSREIVSKQPGFVRDNMYQRTDEHGNLIFMSVAVWESEDAMKKAKENVQAEYKRVGFNPGEIIQRLNIVLDRGEFKNVVQE